MTVALTIRPVRTIGSVACYLTASALPASASRYCDMCGGMPWWEEPLLVLTGLGTAVAILAGFVRLDAWYVRRRASKRGADPPDDGVR